jgi:hypothetical protein
VRRRCRSRSTRGTLFKKSGGPLTKRIELVDGKIANDSSACRMSVGSARRVQVDLGDMRALADLINGFTSQQAYALGRLKEGLPDRVHIVVGDRLASFGGKPNVAARNQDHLIFVEGEPGVGLLDTDFKGMRDDQRLRIEARGVWPVLCDVMPALAGAARVERKSTSYGLRNRETGESYPGSGGSHTAVAVLDSADIPRFLSDFSDRLWLADWGWGLVSAAGTFLVRSLV